MFDSVHFSQGCAGHAWVNEQFLRKSQAA